MPNIKSAKKRVKVTESKTLQNKIFKNQLRTLIKKFNLAVESGDKAAAEESYKLVIKKLDKAAARGIMHENKASRHKSQFTKKFNSLA